MLSASITITFVFKGVQTIHLLKTIQNLERIITKKKKKELFWFCIDGRLGRETLFALRVTKQLHAHAVHKD
jgi:hypothetical protein